MGCSCGGRTRSNPGPLVLARYNPPRSSGVSRVTGTVSGITYGNIRPGEIVPVRVADIVSRLGLWLCPETNVSFTIEGDVLICPEYEGRALEEIIVQERVRRK